MQIGKKTYFFYNEFLLVNVINVCLFEAFPTKWYGVQPDIVLQVQVSLGCDVFMSSVSLCPKTLKKNVGSFPQFQDFIKPRCHSIASTEVRISA